MRKVETAHLSTFFSQKSGIAHLTTTDIKGCQTHDIRQERQKRWRVEHIAIKIIAGRC